ncbi:hypothetical protein ONZ45_g5915 [Pleurotus djamor]|nr:hypothetical protein ONZ45_g5915 [Pleurotus djamor]
MQYTPIDEIEKIHATLRAGFNSGKLKSLAYRRYQLLQLGYLFKDNAKRFEEALKSDLGRPELESSFLEIGPSISDIRGIYKNVEKWAKPEKPGFNINFTPMRPVIRKEPKGVVMIISPFNYPIWLTAGPLAGAIAAGNAVVVKPSENTPAVSSLLAELVPKYLDQDLVRVVNGAIPETTKLLELQWDHILYTGSGRVAKIVSLAAAKHLTPVTLELGGKSPVFIDPKCDLDMATRRILWGKTANAGQTCTAPDYVLVPKDFQDEFIAALTTTYNRFYPETSKASSPGAFARLITPQAFNRVNNLLKETKGTIVLGGSADEATKFIEPTVVKDVAGDDSLMSEEIFGPILPIVPVKDVDEAIAFVNARDHPLALYVFSQDSAYKDKVFGNTQSGAAVANEVLIHCGVDGLPFGGIGPSGSGYHTGKYTFDMFTHLRSSIDSPGWIDKLLGARFPPYNAEKVKALKKVVSTRLPPRPTGPPSLTGDKRWGRWFLVAAAFALAGVLTQRSKVLSSILGSSHA